jgi:hypothetical protein
LVLQEESREKKRGIAAVNGLKNISRNDAGNLFSVSSFMVLLAPVSELRCVSELPYPFPFSHLPLIATMDYDYGRATRHLTMVIGVVISFAPKKDAPIGPRVRQ